MDLNNLYFRHQISLIRASAAGNGKARAVHRADAEDIACQIGRFQRIAGATAAAAWNAPCLAGHEPSIRDAARHGAAL